MTLMRTFYKILVLIATEKGIIQVSFSDKMGELVLTDLGIFFIEAGRIMKVGKSRFDISNRKELEEAISKTKDRVKLRLNSNVFEVLKKELGEFSLGV